MDGQIYRQIDQIKRNVKEETKDEGRNKGESEEEGREGEGKRERQRQTKSWRTQAKEDVSSNSLKMKQDARRGRRDEAVKELEIRISE